MPSGHRLWRTTLGGEIRYSLAAGDMMWADVSHDPMEPEHLVRLDADSGQATRPGRAPRARRRRHAKVGRDVWVATPGGRIVVER